MKKLTLQQALEQQRKALARAERNRDRERAKLAALLGLTEPAPRRTRKRGAK